MRKAVFVLTTIAIAFAASAPAHAAKVLRDRTHSTVSIGFREQEGKPELKQFFGKVDSHEGTCSASRRVLVKLSTRGVDPTIASVYTDQSSTWKTSFINPDGARVYALIEQKDTSAYTCTADASKIIDVEEPAGTVARPERYQTSIRDLVTATDKDGDLTDGRITGILTTIHLPTGTPAQKCRANRTVRLTLNDGGRGIPVAHTTSRDDGSWALNAENLHRGKYYLFVEPSIVNGYYCGSLVETSMLVK